MKKTLVSLLAVFAMLPCASVFAGEYFDDANKVTVTESNKKMVFIAKNTGKPLVKEDVVYVDQDNGGFTEVDFLLKENPDIGFYTILLGGDGECKQRKFFIGKPEDFTDREKLTELDDYAIESTDKQTVTKAYTSSTAIDLAKAKTIVISYGDKAGYIEDKAGYIEMDTLTTGAGSVQLAVVISGIPTDAVINSVEISSTEICSGDLIFE